MEAPGHTHTFCNFPFLNPVSGLALFLGPHCPLLPRAIYFFIEQTLLVQRCGLKNNMALIFLSKCRDLEPPGCTQIFLRKQILRMLRKELNSWNKAGGLSSAQLITLGIEPSTQTPSACSTLIGKEGKRIKPPCDKSRF